MRAHLWKAGRIRRSRHAYLALIVTLYQAAACGQGSKADRILSDEDLFPKEYSEAVVYARDECPDFAKAAGVYAQSADSESTGTSLSVTGASLSVKVADDVQPEITEVSSQHGPPDSVAGEMHYYGDIGFRTGAGGEVMELVVDCVNR